ncbi:MAG: hypothetical protein ACR5LF_00100 [Symbiopectobacterium sp.]
MTQIGNGEQGKDDIQYGEDHQRHAQEKRQRCALTEIQQVLLLTEQVLLLTVVSNVLHQRDKAEKEKNST